MNLFAYSTLITSIASFILGIFVISRNRFSALNKSWFWVCAFMGIWGFGLWGVVTATDNTEALNYQYILDLGAIFIPVFYFKFTLILLGINIKKKNELFFIYAFSIALAFLSFTSFFKKGMLTPDNGFNFWINPGPLYPIFPTFFSFLMLYSFYILASNLKRYSGAIKNQIRYVLAAGIIGFLGGATNFFPQFFGFYPIGNYFVILYVGAVAYAIIRYRLMGIRVIASRIYIYGIISIAIFVLYHLAYFIKTEFLGGIYTTKALTFGGLMAIAFSVGFIPFINFIQKSSDSLFFKGNNPAKIIKDLTIRLNSVINLSQLLGTLADEFKKILSTSDVAVVTFPKNEKVEEGKKMNVFATEKSNFDLQNLERDCSLAEEAISRGKLIIRDELRTKDDKLKKELDKHNIKVISPLFHHHKVVGLIILGEKNSQEGYAQEDIEFIEIMSSQAAVAIENALLYKEVGDFNLNLQQKVNEQTKDLVEKNEYLKKLLEMRSEFLDIASHQLRTPVSVIKGMTSMMLEGNLPPEKEKEFLNAVFQKSMKLADIINDILRASEMDSEKLELKMNAIHTNDFLKRLGDDREEQFKRKNIKFSLAAPKKPLPPILGDERYLEQAIGNLINNAIQYTPNNGEITLKANKKLNTVEIRVIDNGIGIPEKDRPELFNKFCRAENAVDSYTDGSGLGLFIVKKIIDAHHNGKVFIEKSEEGKGTTFTVVLPIA